jgi:ketosteroid isomerase-like protein
MSKGFEGERCRPYRLTLTSRGDAAALVASYTEHGKLLLPHSDIITEKQAIEAFWQSAMDMGIRQIKLESLHLEGEGHTAYDPMFKG